ncbi:hypothetical protein, partial [Spirosoma harenae]
MCAIDQVVSQPSNQVRVTVGNSLTVVGSTTYYIGQTISLTAISSTPGSLTYVWSGPAGFTQSGPVLERLGSAATYSGSYTVVAQASSGCTGRQLVSIIVAGYLNAIQTLPLS